MIRINLLPAYEIKERLLLRTQVAVAMLVAVATVVGCGWVMTRQEAEKTARRTALDNIEAQIDSLEETVKQYKAFEAKLDKLTKQLEVVAKLKSSQRRPAPVLAAVSQSLPEHVWITSMQESAGSIQIVGKSLNDESGYVTFMKNLRESPMFSAVDLIESKEETFLDREVVGFTLTVRIKKPKSEQATS
jgi:Tfp pilus assembly protein PilN